MAGVIAAVLCLLPPILTWSLMVHMALLATLCTMVTVLLLMESRWFERRAISLLIGASVGMLSLSRSMGPLYVGGLGVAVATVSITVKRHDLTGRRLTNMAISLASALLVAGPWWLVSGPAAWRWLTSVKEFSGLPFAGGLQAIPVVGRVMWTLKEEGLATLAFFAALLLASMVHILWTRRRAVIRPAKHEWRDLVFMATITFAVVLCVLSTVSSRGTAFDLPAATLTALVAMLAAQRRGGRVLVLGGVVLATLTVMTVSIPPTGRPPQLTSWVPASPFESDLVQAAGGIPAAEDRPARILMTVVDRISGDSITVFRDDTILNANGLVYELARRGRSVQVQVPTYAVNQRLSRLDTVTDSVLTGSSCYPFHVNVDTGKLEANLRATGYATIWERRISSCNVIVLWSKGTAG